MYVFNFHHVEAQPRHLSRKHITITPDGLRSFIRTLRRLGLQIVPLGDVLAQGGPENVGKRQVVLTFDDGYENFYQYAAPVLIEERCPATVFILAGKIGQSNDWDQGDLPEQERDRLLTHEQLQSLCQSEWIQFGSHGLHHVNYHQASQEVLFEELHASFQLLSQSLGQSLLPVMAYPWGYYTDALLELMTNSPYRYGMTTEKGSWTGKNSPYQVPRYSMYYRDSNPVIQLAKLCRHGIVPGAWL